MKCVICFLILNLMFYAQFFAQGNNEFEVNPEGIYVWGPKTCSLADGKFVVCWQVPFGDHDEIYGQLFNSDGSKIGNTFLVTADLQIYCKPIIASLSDGGFIICWHSWKEGAVSPISIGIFGQLFDAFGTKIGSAFQITDAIDNLDKPTIAPLLNGDFVVCWLQLKGDLMGIRVCGQIFNSSGLKKYDQFQIDAPPQGFLDLPALTTLNNDDFVLLWLRATGDGSFSDIYGQLFNKFADKLEAEFQVNTTTKINAWSQPMEALPVASLRDGGLFVCWHSFIDNNKTWDIIGQQLNSTGAKIGNEFTINTYTQSSQCDPCLASLTNGWFVVVWSSMEQVGWGWQIFGQLYDALGMKIGNEFRVDSGHDIENLSPVVAPQSNGGFVIVWQITGSRNAIVGKCYKPNFHQLQTFSLLFPPIDETLDSPHIRFLWQQPSSIRECYPWEITFNLYIDTDINFSNPQIIKNIEDTTYTIDSLAAGKTYFWKVLAKNLAGDSLWSTQQDWGFFIKPGATSVETAAQNWPSDFELCQNYPNPFNSSTTIRYSLPEHSPVSFKIYDVNGRLVEEIILTNQVRGEHEFRWTPQLFASGVYLIKIQTPKWQKTIKAILLK